MTFDSKHKLVRSMTPLRSLLMLVVLGLAACTQEKPTPKPKNIEQLKMQSQMKALAAEVVKLRESKEEVEQLKATIAALDTQIAVYQAKLDEKVETPKIEVVATPRDPDIINLRGNIYVLIREIDSLKEGMKDLELLNDSLEIQIEQLAFQTHTEGQAIVETPAENEPTVQPAESVAEVTPTVEEPVLLEEPPQPQRPAAQGYAFNADYRMAYNDALNRYFNQEYLESIQEFRVVIEREPSGAYADNSQYWIGECYYSLEDFESAITEFEKVFNFSDNNKSDHALFKIAMSYHHLGRRQKARSQMEQLVSEYPNSELISQAQTFLKGDG